jgi:hypothetical protein
MLIDLLIASDEDGEDVDTFMAIKDLLISSVIGRRKIFSHRPHLFCERRFRTQKLWYNKVSTQRRPPSSRQLKVHGPGRVVLYLLPPVTLLLVTRTKHHEEGYRMTPL